MDLNQLLAQQQLAMQQAQTFTYAVIAVYVALFIFGCWVLYMFYARLREIGVELRKFRIAYESANPLPIKTPNRPGNPSGSSLHLKSSPSSEELKYMPKS